MNIAHYIGPFLCHVLGRGTSSLRTELIRSPLFSCSYKVLVAFYRAGIFPAKAETYQVAVQLKLRCICGRSRLWCACRERYRGSTPEIFW